VQLRNARLVDTNLGANLFHCGLTVVIEADHFLLSGWQRRDRRAHAILGFLPFVGGVGLFGFRRNQGGWQSGFVEVFVVGQGRSRFNRVDPDDRSTEALLVGSDLRGEIRQGWFVSQFPAQLLASGFEFPALPADSTRPGVLAQSVDHGSPDSTFSERLELDAARLVKPVRCVDEPNHTILDKISNVDRVGHRGRDTSGELFYKGNAGNNARIL
jgi:hypothetical protein